MSILLAAFLTVGLMAGWLDDRLDASSQRFMVWSCILTSLTFGVLAELLFAAWRLELPRVRRWKRSLRYIATNWVLALGVGAVVLVLLALPLLDSLKFVELVVSVVVLEFLAVCSLASVLTAGREGHSLTRSVFLRGFGHFALLNAISMVVGVVAGRLYLNIFYPGVG